MARVTTVKKARKDQGRCRKCGTEIKAGDSYKWFANLIGRSSIRKVFCMNCPIRPSDRTTSHHLGALYGATENAEDQLDSMGNESSIDDYAQILTETAEAVTEVAEGYRESQEAIEEGFEHPTQQSDELGEKADELESFAGDLESAAVDLHDLEDPLADEDEFDPDEGDIEQARSDRRDALRDQAQEALSECPL